MSAKAYIAKVIKELYKIFSVARQSSEIDAIKQQVLLAEKKMHFYYEAACCIVSEHSQELGLTLIELGTEIELRERSEEKLIKK